MLKNKKVLIPLMAAMVFLAVYVNVFRGDAKAKSSASVSKARATKKESPKNTESGAASTMKSVARSRENTKAAIALESDRNPFLTEQEQVRQSDQAARLTDALLAGKPAETKSEPEEEEELPPPPPVTVSVILAGPTSKVAVLNGITLREGDFLGEEILLEIRPKQVVLARGESTRVVSINGGAK
ncbi:MAG: hypothetical protein RL885_11525 [Planctomycetota bacterium]